MATAASIVVLIFWAVFFTAISVKELFFKEKEGAEDRLQKLLKPKPAENTSKAKVLLSDRAGENAAIRRIREKLLCAGLKRRSDLEKFLLFKRICYMIPIILAILAYFLLHANLFTIMLVAVLSGISFFIVPEFWLAKAVSHHRREIKFHLPDTLDLLIVALEAGLSFDSAMVRVGEEQQRMSTHVSRELLFTNHQIFIGKARDQALRAMALRCGVPEMDSLVNAILQSNRLGTSLVKTLRAQADTLRKKRKQEIHAQILKAPVKLVFPLIFLIFPTLLILILAPTFFKVFEVLATRGV